MSKIAVCYFSYHGDVDFINESLKALQKTIKKHSEHEVRVFVFDDGRCEKKLKKKELHGSPNLITTHFNRNGNLNGFECIAGMFNEYAKISKNFDYDYLIKLDSDCILNSFDYLATVENRLKKENSFERLAQIGSYFAQICCYGCCQTFTKLGIGNILTLCKHMAEGKTPESQIMRKRVELGWNEDKVTSVLMEMSPVLRVSIDGLIGIKGHLNAWELPDAKWNEWTSVAFKPNKYGTKSWSRGESLSKMRNYVQNMKDTNDTSPLYELIKGKTVAVVGNAFVDEDYSDEIDSADVVIRINNFYNYQSNKVGKRVDALVLSGLCACMDTAPGGYPTQDAIIAEKTPQLFIITEAFNQKLDNVINKRYNNCTKNLLGNKGVDMKYTSGTILLKMLSEMDDVTVKTYAFDKNEKWKNYITSFAKQHENACGLTEENVLRQSLIQKLNG